MEDGVPGSAACEGEPAPVPGRFGTAELRRDAHRPGAWLLRVDGVAQSYVDLVDPTWLEFDYVRLLGDLLDLAAAPRVPRHVVHLGGGGCTLARYVAATRPGSRQLAVEADGPLAALVAERLGTAGFELQVADARDALAQLPPGSADVVVTDVFTGFSVPAHVQSAEHVQLARRALRPGGTYALNIADRPPLDVVRAQAATLQSCFGEVVMLASPDLLRGRRFGNAVLAGSDDGFALHELRRRAARPAGTARVVTGDALAEFAASAPVVTDRTAQATPGRLRLDAFDNPLQGLLGD